MTRQIQKNSCSQYDLMMRMMIMIPSFPFYSPYFLLSWLLQLLSFFLSFFLLSFSSHFWFALFYFFLHRFSFSTIFMFLFSFLFLFSLALFPFNLTVTTSNDENHEATDKCWGGRETLAKLSSTTNVSNEKELRWVAEWCLVGGRLCQSGKWMARLEIKTRHEKSDQYRVK